MKMVPLGEVATIDRATIKPHEIPNTALYVGLEHITKSSRELRPITAKTADVTSTKHRFNRHQILYGKLRPYLAKIATPSFDGICSTDILPITPGATVDRSYLYYFLSQPEKVLEVSKQATGANLPRVKPAALENLTFPLPCLDEQRRIAAILDKADAIRQKRRQAIAHLDTLTQSVFHEMFKDSLSSTPSTTVGELASLVGGKSLPSIDEATDTNNRVLKISAVTTGTFQPLESKAVPDSYEPPESHFVQPNDLLISRANTAELVGASAIVTGEASGLLLPDKIWRFIWKQDTDPIYFHHLLRSPGVRSRISKLATGSGGSMKNISKTKLLSLPIPDVTVDEQVEFASRIRATSHIRTIFHSQPAESLFRSLQSRAFRGEL